MSTHLTKESILALNDLKIETVAVPEWGGDVCVRGMRGSERDSFEQSLYQDGKFTAENIRARLLVRCICTEAGERVFSDSDADALGARNAAALNRLYEVAQQLSGIREKDVEAAVKN